MKQIHIDFATLGLRRTLHRAGPGTWALGALALLLCVACAALGWRLFEQQRSDAAVLNAQRLRANPPPLPSTAPPALPISMAQADAVNAAVLQLNLPWRALHDAVGAATPPEIALITLEPDARKGVLKITAEAANSDAMIAYVEQLKQQELFDGVHLVRHEIDELDAHRPIRFQLEAKRSAP